MGIRGLLKGVRDFLGSTPHVTNFMALFLVIALISLVTYTVIGQPSMISAIIGFSSAIIGAITGYYFNKEQLNASQREQVIQGNRAASYSDELQVLQDEYSELTFSYNEVVDLLERASEALPEDRDI